MSNEFCNGNDKNIACAECMKDNLLLPLFFLISFVPITLLFSSWVVAKYIFLPYVEMVKNEKEIEGYLDAVEGDQIVLKIGKEEALEQINFDQIIETRVKIKFK